MKTPRASARGVFRAVGRFRLGWSGASPNPRRGAGLTRFLTPGCGSDGTLSLIDSTVSDNEVVMRTGVSLINVCVNTVYLPAVRDDHLRNRIPVKA